ncbi:MAG: hypothetical protein KDC35_15490 [Acidobacteria bacterium]|nr:hypothetical protein [Acidobacteriota bacterium]
MRIILIVNLSFTLLAQLSPSLMNQERDEEGLALARVMKPMFVEGPSIEGLLAIGDFFLGDDRPHQARYFYEQALEMDPKSKEARKGIASVDDKLRDLREKYINYSKSATEKNDVNDLCSMAAIAFHQGYPQKAIEILDNAMIRFPQTAYEPSGLKTTFVHGVYLEDQTLTRLEKELHLATFDGKFEEASILAGRMISIGLGKSRTIAAIREFQAMFPEKVNEKWVGVLSGMSRFFDSPMKIEE